MCVEIFVQFGLLLTQKQIFLYSNRSLFEVLNEAILEFVKFIEWPQNSPDSYLFDYHVWKNLNS